ncbi:MAG: hypothetical protein M3N68_13165 [Actinomycetota bacterium]|nr:hypothetical protein [Actinomycetota bacterium]
MNHDHERHQPAPARRSRARRAAAGLVAGLALLAAACGGSSGASDAKVASVADKTARDGGEDRVGDKAATGEPDPEKAALAFARCMRENGVDMPDPETGGDGMVLMQPGDGPLPSEEKMTEAAKSCDHLMKEAGPPKLSPEDQSRLQDAMVAFARCMRENGVDLPDPEPGEGGGMRMRVGDPRADPQSPAFQAAEKKCQPLMADLAEKAGITATREGGRR